MKRALRYFLMIYLCHILSASKYHKTESYANSSISGDPEEAIKELIQRYMKHQRPRNSPNDRKPVIVYVNIFITSFSSVSVVDMDYSLDLLLRQRWIDKRLRLAGDYNHLSISYLKDDLWIPDLFFRNAKDGKLHTITTPNYLIWISQTGEITFSQKLTVKLSCPMDLWNFPLDTQTCLLEIGSYGYSMEDLQFRWWADYDSRRNEPNVTISESLHLSEFARPTYVTDYCNKEYKTTGNFTCIHVKFTLARKFGFYLIYTYLPSILIIMISWISFLIDYRAVPARISIGLLSVLALMTESAATVQKLPRVSYVKAIDVWLFACLAFVVLSLLEFAIVNTIARRQAKYRMRHDLQKAIHSELLFLGQTTAGLMDSVGGRSSAVTGRLISENRVPDSMNHYGNDENNKIDHSDEDEDDYSRPQMLGKQMSGHSTESHTKHRNERISKEYAIKARKLDRIFLIAFPLGFAFFNLIYWLYFSSLLRGNILDGLK